jgi:hypothetical protein
MDEGKDNDIYDGYECFYYNKNGQYLYKLAQAMSSESETKGKGKGKGKVKDTDMGEEEEGKKGVNENEGENINKEEDEGKEIIGSRHFISLIDESIYKKGVFRRLSKRKKAAALFLFTGGAVSKRAERRARSIFIKYINDSGLPLLNELLLQYATGPIKTVLDLLSEKENYPVGLYCTAGKDRTGLLIYLILAAIGMDYEAIKADYVLSDSAYADMNQKKAFVGALEQNNLDPNKFLIAPPYVIDDLKEHIDLKYGSVEAYLDMIGFDEEKRQKLKENLLLQFNNQ